MVGSWESTWSEIRRSSATCPRWQRKTPLEGALIRARKGCSSPCDPLVCEQQGEVMAETGATAGLTMFGDLLNDAHRALDLDFGFELWDAPTVPADLPSYAMRLV